MRPSDMHWSHIDPFAAFVMHRFANKHVCTTCRAPPGMQCQNVFDKSWRPTPHGARLELAALSSRPTVNGDANG